MDGAVILGDAARRYAARPAARPRTVANPRKDRTMIRAVIFSASAIALVVPAAAQPAANVADANHAALQEPYRAGVLHAAPGRAACRRRVSQSSYISGGA